MSDDVAPSAGPASVSASRDSAAALARPLRVVLLGAGKMARHHAAAIGRLEGRARVVGYADPSADARQEMSQVAPGATAAESPDELLDPSVADVVHVCTPPPYHAAGASAALSAGLHVYVEKPFAPTLAEAREVLGLAEKGGRLVCAGHQLLHEPPTRKALELLPALGDIIHVESYFSFRTVRRTPDGRAPLAAHLQLLDILPHPVYLLLHFLEAAAPDDDAVVAGFEVGPAGTVHALVRAGATTGALTVTLEGRPIESYLRIVGSNGSLTAEYVRGTVQRALGPGVSGIDKVLHPYRQARQLATGTTGALWRRFAGRQRSYPGLAEIFLAFYDAIQEGRPSPVSNRNILATTQICAEVGSALEGGAVTPVADSARREGRVVVTGGTGFLGRGLVRALQQLDRPVSVISRRPPAPWERQEGVENVEADLGDGLDSGVLSEADVVVHCAAATSGGWDVHERDSIAATRHLLEAAAQAGVRRVIHVSSLAVQVAPSRGGRISEETPLASDSRARGPYAWGKHESERLAVDLARELGLELKVVRPGALVDYARFDPPGRLGRRLGNLFVAVGSGSDRLGVCDVSLAGEVIAWMVTDWERAPDLLNLLEPELPTKRDLVARLRRTDPDLTVLWLPRLVLAPLSAAAVLLQKVLRPGRPAISVARVYAPEAYDTTAVQGVVDAMADAG